MVSSSPSQSASSASLGRERALEVLMDRDPLGSYYRAARAVVSFFVSCCRCGEGFEHCVISITIFLVKGLIKLL